MLGVIVHLRPSLNFMTHVLRCCFNIYTYFFCLMMLSILWNAPVPSAAKHPHNMILPAPCSIALFLVWLFYGGFGAVCRAFTFIFCLMLVCPWLLGSSAALRDTSSFTMTCFTQGLSVLSLILVDLYASILEEKGKHVESEQVSEC